MRTSECNSCRASVIWTGRFWSKVDRSGECWLWTASCNTHGYGSFWLKGKNVGAHIVSYEMTHGPVPDGLHVLHHCDNRPCVRPDHLYAGTHQQNMDDRARRGRTANGCGWYRGELRPTASLTDQQARHIRERYAEGGITQHELAAEAGVKLHVVTDIIRRRTWRHI